MSDLTHFLLTRFNVKLEFDCEDPAATHSKRLDSDWLGERFRLFERFCLPSVVRQRERDFTWLVFFDEQTPEPYRSRIEAYREEGVLDPVFVSWFDPEGVREEIRRRLPPRAERVMTSRLDNDDALARSFTARVQRELRNERRLFLNFLDGYQYADGFLYPTCGTSNPFLSLVEPVGELQTVLCVPHTEVVQRFPTRQVKSQFVWMQVIHGSNVYNQVDFPDRRWPMWLAAREFPILREFLRDRGPIGPVAETGFSVHWATRQLWRRVVTSAGRATETLG